MRGTFLIELHPWRGFRRDADLFLRVWTLGWVTLAWSRFLLTDRLRDFIDILRMRGDR